MISLEEELFQSSINNPTILQCQANRKQENIHDQPGPENYIEDEQINLQEDLEHINDSCDVIIQENEGKNKENLDVAQEENDPNNCHSENIEVQTNKEEINADIKDITGQQKESESKADSNQKERLKEEQKAERLLAQGNAMKDEAKEFVQKRQYKAAVQLYEECLKLVDSESVQYPELIKTSQSKNFLRIWKELIELRMMLLCNMSLCYYNDGDFESSLKYGEKVSTIDPNHLKAAYRRALALKKLNRFEQAFDEIKNARLIAIGRQQVDELINKEYKIIKQLHFDAKGLPLSQNNSMVNPSEIKPKTEMTNSNISNISNISNVVEFLDDNFPHSTKTTPFYAICSATTTFIFLKRFMNIDLTTKSALLAAPLLSFSMFGFLQAKRLPIKLVCGAFIGIISALLFRITKLPSNGLLALK